MNTAQVNANLFNANSSQNAQQTPNPVNQPQAQPTTVPQNQQHLQPPNQNMKIQTVNIHTPEPTREEILENQLQHVNHVRDLTRLLIEERAIAVRNARKMAKIFGFLIVVIFIFMGCNIHSQKKTESTLKELRSSMDDMENVQDRIMDLYQESKDDTQLYTSSVQLMSTMQNALVLEQQKRIETEHANSKRSNRKKEL